jgi:hypothetical protein
LKAKNYEITNPQIISWGDRHHWSHIEFHRIRAAGAIARNDDHNERPTDNNTGIAGVRFSRRADRVISGPPSGANPSRFDLSTGSNSASTVDEQQ